MIRRSSRRRRGLGQDDEGGNFVPSSGVYAPDNVLTPNPNSMNLPESAPVTLDPNAPGIAANQAANYIPDTDAGNNYSGAGALFSGLFGANTNLAPSTASSALLWLGLAIVGGIAVLGLVKK